MAFVPGYPVYMQPVVRSSTSKSFFLYITAASGLPVAGLAFDTADLLASYAGTKLARVSITLADLATIDAAWSSGGFLEVDGTNMPGWYRLDLPNAALALAADEVVVTIVKDAVCQSSLVIPIPTVTNATTETKVDTQNARLSYTHKVLDTMLIGATSQSIKISITGPAGAPVTGLAFDTSGLLASYSLNKAARVAITLATQTVTGAFSSGGFVEIDATNMPGVYRLDLPNAALASSASVEVVIWKSTVCFGAVTIPLATGTMGSVATMLIDADLGNPLTGTLAENVEAIGEALPGFDVTNPNTTRTDN